MKHIYLSALFLFLLAGSVRLNAQQRYYVKANASGANNGLSWNDAFPSLVDALTAAVPGDEIWVAAGTYKPAASPANASFSVKSGLKLYGGFAGTENSLEERNIAANVTTLSGDQAGNDITGDFTQNRTDNARHVINVTGGNLVQRTFVDGFVIRGGHTLTGDNDPTAMKRGGGILATTKVTVRNTTFTDNRAQAGAGITVSGGNATGLLVDNCLFERNEGTASSAGVLMLSQNAGEINKSIFRNNTGMRGCVYPDACKNIIVDSCLFEDNVFTGFGAGMFTWQSSFTVSNSIFRSNQAENAAGMYNDGRNGGNSFVVDNCLFEENVTTNYGGSAMFNFVTNQEIKNSQFKGNEAPQSAGAIYNSSCVGSIHDCLFEENEAGFGAAMAIFNESAGVGLTVDHCTFQLNSAVTSGGAIIDGFLAAPIIKNSTFLGNTASFGGAIFVQNDSTKLIVENSSFEGNAVASATAGSAQGGAINISAGNELIVRTSIFRDNSADFGGAIQIAEDSLDLTVVTIERSVFRDNLAFTQGAALNINDADVTITNTLFAYNLNLGVGAGGAISNNATNDKVSKVTVVNSTIANNTAPIGAGIAQWEDVSGNAILELQNTILDNPDGDNYEIELGMPEVISLGGNLSSDATLSGSLTGTNDQNEADPLFVDSEEYDYHLQAGSPAINTGVATGAPSIALDGGQRDGQPDKGAYEFGSVGTFQPAVALTLELLPNPAVDHVVLQVENEWTGPVAIDILDAAGHRLQSLTTDKTSAAWQFRAEVKALPQGVYFVQARMGKGVYVGSLVKE